jgi:hypothetical protein
MSNTFIAIESLKGTLEVLVDFWWIFVPLFLWPIFQLTWVAYVQEKYMRGIKWNLLEIKVSSELEIRPKTMEEFFAALAGTFEVVIDTLYDIYLAGMVDAWFSFEIVSFEGDIHFYIRTPEISRGMIEAQIYAEYPDAEIVEVEDYVNNIPGDVPNADYDIWGTDMTLAKDSGYPIRTYMDFEDQPSGEFVDPVANIVEGVTKLGPDEQIWVQFLVKPAGDYWRVSARDTVLILAGRKKAKSSSGGFFSQLINEVVDLFRHILFDFFNSEWVDFASSKEEKSSDLPSMMLHLSTGERDIIDHIDRKVEKPGFETDIRYIYAAKRSVYNKTKANTIVFTYFSQFGTEFLNRLIPDGKTKTSAYYFFPDARKAIKKRSILRKYRDRVLDKKSYVLTTDELATLFHFPTKTVKAPKIDARKGKPPASLPV